MSYLRKTQWDIIPSDKPKVIRNCPKCGKKTHYLNTEKFRVNANKNLIDAWLIYQCSKCKSTWNLTLYERISPGDIDQKEYEKLLANDKELAEIYGFDISVHNRNKAELIFDSIDYKINARELGEREIANAIACGTADELLNKQTSEVIKEQASEVIKEQAREVIKEQAREVVKEQTSKVVKQQTIEIEYEHEIKIACKYPIQLRIDKLLSRQLSISRSQIKKLFQKGLIYSLHGQKLLNSKVEDGMVIYLKSSIELPML